MDRSTDMRANHPAGLSEATDPLSLAVAERDRETLAEVARALDENRVALAFQPVVAARETGRVAFEEGLIRILDPSGRVIPAREFMWAAETRELGRRIDCAALQMGLAALIRVPDLRLSINMSARSIGYPRWSRILDGALAQHPTLAERLILEITEASAMLIPDLVAVFMEEKQRRGVSFALDDFGAGFTSFRYLRDFAFDILKIDGQFVRGITSAGDNQVLLRALIGIGRHFEMLTVAESVETPTEAAWLAEAGIDCLQGYHFGAPTIRPGWLLDRRRRA
jgi:EAL domain-containing protein (putative c-di-GMP-specific phosphodiesterase class I)